MVISPQRRQEIIDALRRGTVPRTGLDAFAVNLIEVRDVRDALEGGHARRPRHHPG